MINRLKQRFQKKAAEIPLGLSIPAVNGDPVITFPPEVIDQLRRMVIRVGRENPLPARFSLVSTMRGEGVSYLAQALGATIANDLRARVCIVDLNWWWPNPSPLVAPDNGGLAALLSREASLGEVIAPTGWSNLALLPAGNLSKQDRPVVARSQALREIINDLSIDFDHLILDIPAIQATNDAVPLAGLGTACCMVVRQGVTRLEDVRLALDEVRHLPVLGVILNQVNHSTPLPLVRLIAAV